MNLEMPRPIILAGIMFVCSLAASAQEALHDRSEKILWKSDNHSRAEIPGAIAKLYTSLYNTDQLPLMEVQINKGQTVEQLMRDAGVFFGPHFPVEIDSLLCDLNADQCNRDLVPIDPSQYNVTTAHTGGYEFSKGSWMSRPGDTLLIPMIEFEEYEEFLVSWKNSGESIKEILYNRRVTCEQFGVDCYEAVRIFNQSNPEALEDSYEGRIVLPTRGVAAYITLAHDGASDEDTNDPIETVPQSPQLQIRQMPEYFEETQKWEHREEKAFEALEQNSVAWGTASKQADFSTEPHFTTQFNLFELINHPELIPGWTPDMDWSKATVAVLDSWVDKNHCDIGPNIEVHNEVDSATEPAADPALCGQLEPANPIEHHGTHVAALLGASLNGKGIAGLLPPASKIYTHEVKDHRLGDAAYRQQVSDDIHLIAVQTLAKTYNLSWFYTNDSGGLDVLENSIAVMTGSALVVAPAGNNSQDFSAGGCSLLPACFYNYPNVITVVGLDRGKDNPQLWVSDSGSSAGSSFASFFHVGAIAENILSATKSNKHGTLSGTSQAAPQVSATAGYLWAIIAANTNRTPNPQEIKNRIIYTADYFPHLKNKVMGGRLNMAKALDIGATVIETIDGSTVNGVFSGYKGADGSVADIVILRHNGNRVDVAFSKLKRLIRDHSGARYIAYYVDVNGVLVRKVGAELLTRSQEIYIFPAGSVVATQIPLVQIADYTAAF